MVKPLQLLAGAFRDVERWPHLPEYVAALESSDCNRLALVVGLPGCRSFERRQCLRSRWKLSLGAVQAQQQTTSILPSL